MGERFDLTDKSYIKISGIKIQNAGPNDNNAGIYVDGSDHIIIEKNHTYNTASSGIGYGVVETSSSMEMKWS
jgi:polygalacturonase